MTSEGTLALFPASFDEQAAAEIYEDPDAIMGGAFFPPGEAVPVEGGFRLTGRMPFMSGCHHCSWFLGQAFIMESF